MTESTNADLADRTNSLSQIAGNIINICETTFQDVLDTLTREWECDASTLFVSRMEDLREEVLGDANNLLAQTQSQKILNATI